MKFSIRTDVLKWKARCYNIARKMISSKKVQTVHTNYYTPAVLTKLAIILRFKSKRDVTLFGVHLTFFIFHF